MEDDGGTTAQVVPIMDFVLGSMLLVKRTRLLAAIIIDVFMIFGLCVQISAGKRFEIDLIMIAVATGAVIQARSLNQK